MRILVTNDDGIKAEGIRRLTEALAGIEGAEVYVAAPSVQQSGKSQSITFQREVAVEETLVPGAVKAFAVDGTPADCVIWALTYYMREQDWRFDYVFSGINIGSNVGAAAYYSGTISAASEGALAGIHSVALSVDGHECMNFDYVCGMIPELIMMSDALDASTVLSVNAPDLPAYAVKGSRIVPPSPWGYGDDFVFEKAASGDFQMLPRPAYISEGINYDYDCVAAGYAAITPLRFEISDCAALGKLRSIKE